MGKICQICGDPSGFFPLCKKHNEDKENGLVIKDETTGQWILKQEPNKKDDEITCLICGEISNGKHFCINCYKQYAKKVLYLKVKKCKEFEKLEAEYESDFVCDDGHLVKSPYEKIIDNWLYKEEIRHAYETKIDVDKDTDITPDFYIPEYNGKKDIYIEFWGYDESNLKYQQIKEYKLKTYPILVKNRNITVVYLNKKEVENDSYKKKIKYATEGIINE